MQMLRMESGKKSYDLVQPEDLPHKQLSSLVSISYEDLVAGKDLSSQIYEAYGPEGLGALTISGVPDFTRYRKSLLPLSHKLAHSPEVVKAKLEHEPSMYNVGWSHGKEKLGNKPDLAKGSFYGNPVYDQVGTEEQEKKYPFFYPRNIWPKEDIPELEPAFKNLGKTMFDAIALLAQHIDKLSAERIPGYTPNLLKDNLSNTRKIKGRLLYYYPVKNEEQTEDGWIGWHNDSGFLTGLCPAIFVDDKTGEEIPNPDPEGGLWIIDRSGKQVHVKIPPDHLGVQCGECLQIVTGGLLVATPHSVRPSRCPPGLTVGRASFPVFIDTDIEFPLNAPSGVPRTNVFHKTMASKVPPLQERWTRDGMMFVDFLGDTFKQYYEWNKGTDEM